MAHPNTDAANSAMETVSITLLAMIEIVSQMHVYGIVSEFLAGSRSQLTLLHRPCAHNIFNTSYIPQIPHYQKSKTHPTFSQQLESSDVSKPYSFLCFAHLVLPDQLNIRETG